MSALFFLLVGCQHLPPDPTPERTYDVCDCCMWGVTGEDPGPDYEPPPLPEACVRILEKNEEACGTCPVPM